MTRASHINFDGYTAIILNRSRHLMASRMYSDITQSSAGRLRALIAKYGYSINTDAYGRTLACIDMDRGKGKAKRKGKTSKGARLLVSAYRTRGKVQTFTVSEYQKWGYALETPDYEAHAGHKTLATGRTDDKAYYAVAV